MSELLLTTLTNIQNGDIVLPDIQRSFIWKKSQIYSLYDSLFRGYPVGSFLLWKAIGSNDPENIILYHQFIQNYSENVGIPMQIELKSNESKMFVLDGQQRLQAFYLGIMGSYEGKELYVDLLSGFNDETHIKDSDEGILYFVKFLNIEELNDLQKKNSNRCMVRYLQIQSKSSSLTMFYIFNRQLVASCEL